MRSSFPTYVGLQLIAHSLIETLENTFCSPSECQHSCSDNHKAYSQRQTTVSLPSAGELPPSEMASNTDFFA